MVKEATRLKRRGTVVLLISCLRNVKHDTTDLMIRNEIVDTLGVTKWTANRWMEQAKSSNRLKQIASGMPTGPRYQLIKEWIAELIKTYNLTPTGRSHFRAGARAKLVEKKLPAHTVGEGDAIEPPNPFTLSGRSPAVRKQPVKSEPAIRLVPPTTGLMQPTVVLDLVKAMMQGLNPDQLRKVIDYSIALMVEHRQ